MFVSCLNFFRVRFLFCLWILVFVSIYTKHEVIVFFVPNSGVHSTLVQYMFNAFASFSVDLALASVGPLRLRRRRGALDARRDRRHACSVRWVIPPPRSVSCHTVPTTPPSLPLGLDLGIYSSFPVISITQFACFVTLCMLYDVARDGDFILTALFVWGCKNVRGYSSYQSISLLFVHC